MQENPQMAEKDFDKSISMKGVRTMAKMQASNQGIVLGSLA